MTRALGVGIVGTNWGAIAHLPVWRSLPGVEVRGICTSRRETAEAAAADLTIANPFWDFRQMAESPEIDIFVCGTRPPLRTQMTLAALAAGKHVLNNIPFATNMDEAAGMLEAQRGNGLIGAVDAFFQWVPALRRMKELVDDGYLGRPRHIHLAWNMPVWNRPFHEMGLKWFADARNGATGLRNMGGHCVHALVAIFGPVVEVVGEAAQYEPVLRYPDGVEIRSQITDSGVALLRLASGALVTLNVSWVATAGRGFSLEAFGDRGRLAARSMNMPQSFSTRLYGGEAGPMEAYDQPEVEMDIPDRLLTLPGVTLRADDPDGPYFANAAVAIDMLRAIREGGDAAPSFAQALHVQQVFEAISRSERSRAWTQVNVPLPETGAAP